MDIHIGTLANAPALADEVARLKHEQWRHTAPDRPWSVWLGEIQESAQVGAFPCTLVALVQDDLVGFVTLIQIPERARVRGGVWLITLYVKPAYRRRGVGTALIDRCVEIARDMDYDALYLWTESSDLTAYYTRRGWQLIGTDPDDGEDVMRFSLA
jgi:GNAT superfamily N-acetyltransferase